MQALRRRRQLNTPKRPTVTGMSHVHCTEQAGITTDGHMYPVNAQTSVVWCICGQWLRVQLCLPSVNCCMKY